MRLNGTRTRSSCIEKPISFTFTSLNADVANLQPNKEIQNNHDPPQETTTPAAQTTTTHRLLRLDPHHQRTPKYNQSQVHQHPSLTRPKINLDELHPRDISRQIPQPLSPHMEVIHLFQVSITHIRTRDPPRPEEYQNHPMRLSRSRKHDDRFGKFVVRARGLDLHARDSKYLFTYLISQI